MEEMQALQKNLEDRTRTESTNELSVHYEHEEEEEDQEALAKAALCIQNKFREFVRRKSSKEMVQTATNGLPQSAHSVDSGI